MSKRNVKEETTGNNEKSHRNGETVSLPTRQQVNNRSSNQERQSLMTTLAAFRPLTWTAQVKHSPLVVVSCYNEFKALAHRPRGEESRHCLQIYKLDSSDGSLTLVSVSGAQPQITPRTNQFPFYRHQDNSTKGTKKQWYPQQEQVITPSPTTDTTMQTTVTPLSQPINNLAFSRFHPSQNILYSVTEELHAEGHVHGYRVNPITGELRHFCHANAMGKSTCYITIDRNSKHMLLVNYWDSTISVLPINPAGQVQKCCCVYDAKTSEQQTSHNRHVNHAENDENAIKERQSEPHLHALVLDPIYGKIAYVPDLGMDLIRQFYYDDEEGYLIPMGSFPSGPKGAGPHGPRYIEFHQSMKQAYVVNELGSNVCVFHFDKEHAKKLIKLGEKKMREIRETGVGYKRTGPVPFTLECIQMISTIPEGYPRQFNTCGRIAVHPSGYFVIVSNRGHDSLTVYRVHPESNGRLSLVGYQHTKGKTPRHFQFDPTGQWLLTANQDTNSVTVSMFNQANGKILHERGRNYHVPSPNFVCCFNPHYGPDMSRL